MLSTIGRAAIRRVGGGASQSTNRALQSIWHLQRVDANQNPENPLARLQFSFTPQRSYATTTKAAPKTKPKTKSTTKAKSKPNATAKKAAKKPAKKPVKRKAAAKKPKPKRRPVKPLTEEQKLKAQIKELKAKALLDGPKPKPYSSWAVLLQEYMQGSTGAADLGSRSSQAAAKYKTLSPEELESYNHTANQNKAANAAAYKQWVESHTPDQINTANNARKQLKRKTSSTSKYPPIQDSRLPKKPYAARLHFAKERHASGDLKGISSLMESNLLINKEWAALSASEKKPYEDRANADKRRYIQEYKTVFHRDSATKVE